MGAIASQITSLAIVYPDAYQTIHQRSGSLAFVRGIHRWTVISPHKGPVTRKMFSFDDVIMKEIHRQDDKPDKYIYWIYLYDSKMVFFSIYSSSPMSGIEYIHTISRIVTFFPSTNHEHLSSASHKHNCCFPAAHLSSFIGRIGYRIHQIYWLQYNKSSYTKVTNNQFEINCMAVIVIIIIIFRICRPDCLKVWYLWN